MHRMLVGCTLISRQHTSSYMRCPSKGRGEGCLWLLFPKPNRNLSQDCSSVQPFWIEMWQRPPILSSHSELVLCSWKIKGGGRITVSIKMNTTCMSAKHTCHIQQIAVCLVILWKAPYLFCQHTIVSLSRWIRYQWSELPHNLAFVLETP